jgi:hypothetical protein
MAGHWNIPCILELVCVSREATWEPPGMVCRYCILRCLGFLHVFTTFLFRTVFLLWVVENLSRGDTPYSVLRIRH